MLSQIRAAATFLGLFTLLLGIGYPLAMTAVAGVVFPTQAGGSLVSRDGTAIGSALVGQSFVQPGYLQPRPSAAGDGYDASASSGTNLAPTSAKLAERLNADGEAMRAATGAALLPADAITTSGSGLDPHVSPAFAELQVVRIAQTRGLPAAEVRRLIGENTAGRTLGILGEPRVDVLAVNIGLDRLTAGALTANPDASAPNAPATTLAD